MDLLRVEGAIKKLQSSVLVLNTQVARLSRTRREPSTAEPDEVASLRSELRDVTYVRDQLLAQIAALRGAAGMSAGNIERGRVCAVVLNAFADVTKGSDRCTHETAHAVAERIADQLVGFGR
jgi:hypothetical protein